MRIKSILEAVILGLCIAGIVVLMNGCQSSLPKWQGYRFDKNWKAYPI